LRGWQGGFENKQFEPQARNALLFLQSDRRLVANFINGINNAACLRSFYV
jgi:hypothetical protein